MSKAFPPPSPPTKSAPAIYQWPWGQVALFLIVLTFCLNAIHDLAKRFGGDFGETIQGLFAVPGTIGLACALFAWWSSDKLRTRGEVRQSNPGLRRINFAIGGLWLSLILLQILVPALRAAVADSGHPDTGDLSIEMKSVTSTNGAVAIHIPGSWTEIPPASRAPALLAYLSPTQQTGVAVFVEARRDLTVSNATEYAELTHTRISKEFGPIELLELTSSAQPGMPELQEQVEVAKDGEKLRFLLAYQAAPTVFVHVRAWGSPSAVEENENLLLEIVNSAHWVGDEAAIGPSERAVGGRP